MSDGACSARGRAPVDSSFQLRKLIGLPSENKGILYCIVVHFSSGPYPGHISLLRLWDDL